MLLKTQQPTKRKQKKQTLQSLRSNPSNCKSQKLKHKPDQSWISLTTPQAIVAKIPKRNLSWPDGSKLNDAARSEFCKFGRCQSATMMDGAHVCHPEARNAETKLEKNRIYCVVRSHNAAACRLGICEGSQSFRSFKFNLHYLWENSSRSDPSSTRPNPNSRKFRSHRRTEQEIVHGWMRNWTRTRKPHRRVFYFIIFG